MPRPEIEWRDLTPPGCAYEVHGAPLDGDGVEYRHRLIARKLATEPRSNFMIGDPWQAGLPAGVADPMAKAQ